jgi:hypothetical protein
VVIPQGREFIHYERPSRVLTLCWFLRLGTIEAARLRRPFEKRPKICAKTCVLQVFIAEIQRTGLVCRVFLLFLPSECFRKR